MSGGSLWAANPTAEQALKLTPVHKEVDYEQPTGDELAKCEIAVEKNGKQSGWVVKTSGGRMLRRFVDTNADNVVDLWCYYQDGFEVYRDIDSDFNGKADQCRWLGPAGTRWGIDANEDGEVDRWKSISAEEVSAEVVAAVAQGDAAAFARVKLSKEELDKLGLSKERAEQLAEHLKKADEAFKKLLAEQKALNKQTTWQRFDALRPGLFPAEGDGTSDVKVYENVLAVTKTGSAQHLLQVGTLVSVGEGWRVIDAPQVLDSAAPDFSQSGFFFRAQAAAQTAAAHTESGAPTAAMQKLMADLEAVDRAAATAEGSALATHNNKRIDLIEKLIAASETKEDKEQWTRQLSDTLGLIIQVDPQSNGVERLYALVTKTKADPQQKDLAAYVEFRYLMARYSYELQQPKADFAKIQTAWLDNLERFVTSYPTSEDTAEALLQLGMAQELAGQDDEAVKWYGQAVQKFPQSAPGKKASGAAKRLSSVGKPIHLAGKSLTGQTIDLAAFKGKVVLIDYWATWCEPCKADQEVLKQLVAKYGRSGFVVIGISLDNDAETVSTFLKQNRLPWYHIYEPGGLESRLANEMGILTLPTKILVDAKGQVLHRSIHASQVEDELKKIYQPSTRTATPRR